MQEISIAAAVCFIKIVSTMNKPFRNISFVFHTNVEYEKSDSLKWVKPAENSQTHLQLELFWPSWQWFKQPYRHNKMDFPVVDASCNSSPHQCNHQRSHSHTCLLGGSIPNPEGNTQKICCPFCGLVLHNDSIFLGHGNVFFSRLQFRRGWL